MKLIKVLIQVLLVGILFLIIFGGLGVFLARAEEGEVPVDALIITGEAEANTEIVNDINNSSTTTEGTIDDCKVEVECSSENDNETELAVVSDTEATTGDNQNVGSSETAVIIDTGGAVAVLDETNQINSNIMELGATETEVDEASGIDIIDNENLAIADSQNEVKADSGNNSVVGENTVVTIETGEAVAWANVINLINTNVVAANFGIYILNDFGSVGGDIDLNVLWDSLLSGAPGVVTIQSGKGMEGNNLVIIRNDNIARVSNEVTVVANSGDNLVAGGGDVLVITGEATALANVINLINTNIVGSQFYLGVINVDGSTLGDIILPNPEKFGSNNIDDNGGGLIVNNENMAIINNEVKATAGSGENMTVNTVNSLIDTGMANSWSNDLTMVNLNENYNGQMILGINILGVSSGKIYNWAYPGSEEEWVDNQALFVLNDNYCQNCSGDESKTIIDNQNGVVLDNAISVSATSGNNQIIGAYNGTIISGGVRAVVNLVNIVNLNIFGSKWFLGVINVVGDWSGNAIFAYPDLKVLISGSKTEGNPGDEIEYLLTYQNIGHEMVNDANLKISFGKEIAYISDDSGILPLIEENSVGWSVGQINSGEIKSFRIKVRLGEVEGRVDKEVMSQVVISTSVTEVNAGNNTTAVTTKIWYPTNNNSIREVRVPKLIITAKNNVNDYILPNDIVTFEVNVSNEGEGKAQDSYLIHEIYDEYGNLWQSNQIYLGDIDFGMKGSVNFGVVMMVEGMRFKKSKSLFYTKSWIEAKRADDGQYIDSNLAKTVYGLKTPVYWEKGEVLAAEEGDGSVLAWNSQNYCPLKQDVLPYLLLFGVSGLWLQRQTSIWLKRIKKQSN